MAGRRPLSRPRTKLYDYNYSLGEQLYKPMMDRLDRKYSGRPAEDLESALPRRPASFVEVDDVPRRRSLSSLLGKGSGGLPLRILLQDYLGKPPKQF